LLNPPVVVKELRTLPPYTTCTGLLLAFVSTFSVAFLGFPPLHCKSSVIPPRTRAPLIAPEDHCLGSAGSRVMVRGMDKVGTSGAWRSAFYKWSIIGVMV
jgi:hypothetical protein